MHRYFAIGAACAVAFVLGIVTEGGISTRTATMAGAHSAAGAMSPALADAPTMAKGRPTEGWTLHIDAKRHFGDAHPDEIAHHYCKGVSGGLFECQIYDSDAPDARLVALETIVSPSVYKSLPPQEQALWHYHRVEVPKVDAKLPDLSPEEAKKTLNSILDTYGKVWVLWDPQSSQNPVGTPTVSILK